MPEYFNSRLAQLESKEALRFVFDAYKHLASMPQNPGSGTWKLLQRLKAGDPTAFTECYRKVLEEEGEAQGVLGGWHYHEGLDPRATMTMEAGETKYWAELPVVGSAEFDIVAVPQFLDMGYNGARPLDIPKGDWKAGVKGRADEEAVRLCRHVLVTAGRFLHDYNAGLGKEHGLIVPKDLAVWDLNQMAEREYLHPFLKQIGLLPTA